MRYFHLLALVIIGFLFYGCTTEISGDKETFSRSYVQCYQLVNSCTIHPQTFSGGMQLDLQGERLTNQSSIEFIKLSNYYNDNTYNKRMVGGPNMALGTEFDAIDIVSDTDFSTDLPAGTSLGSVTKLFAISPAKYIKSGYRETYDWNNITDEFKEVFGNFSAPDGYYPVVTLIKDIKRTDLSLLDPQWISLKFIQTPEINKNHNFTITLSHGEESISSTIVYIFE